MDIRASLLLDNLRSHFSVILCGRMTDAPLLRPIFYQEGMGIEKNRIYIVHPTILPPREQLDNSNLLICVEGFPSLSYQHSGLALFIVKDESALSVFNEILSVFERYEVWENSLKSAVNGQADIADLVQLTAPLILNDITVIDQDLRVIAAANYKRNQEGKVEVVKQLEDSYVIPLRLISQYKRGFEENVNKRGAFFADEGCYCVNLYDDDRYLGNVSLFPRVDHLRQSDPYIIDILADYVLKTFLIQSHHTKTETSDYTRIVQKLLDRESVEQSEISRFSGTTPENQYSHLVCFCIRLSDDLHSIPAESICQTLSTHLTNLIVFPYNSVIFGLQPIPNGSSTEKTLAQPLQEVLISLNLYAGISSDFDDIRKVRFHYQQAQCALSFQSQGKRRERLFFFRDYTFHYMMMNSSGIFPAEYLCPPGLLQLRKYDEGSNVDYWNTLRCYLDEQMNVSQTAKILSIHRNTLLQRIDRIYSVLGTDLSDPMLRLWIRVAMYLFDAEMTMS